jgi:hypothetical protein
MKSNLTIKKYNITKVNGVKSNKEVKSFFGSKLIDIEDVIYINNIAIQYTEVVNKRDIKLDHYQNYSQEIKTGTGLSILYPETVFLKSLDDVKYENHSIDVLTSKDPKNLTKNQNYEWVMNINAKNILREYLFLRLKESRVFKTVRSQDLIERNINTYIYNYINENLLNRYNISDLSFYAEFFDVINNSTIYQRQTLKTPNFNKTIFKPTNKITNVSIITPDYLSNLDTVQVKYNQTKDFKKYKYDYYYTITYKKI